MFLTRRQFAALAAAAVAYPAGADTDSLYQLHWDLMFGDRAAVLAAIDAIIERGQPDMAAGVIQAMRFGRVPEPLLAGVLEVITGAQAGPGWFDWMLWQEANPQVVPHASFTRIKRDVLLRIDPAFEDFLRPEYLARDRMKIRLEEITWGGVRKDGIPSLDAPPLIAADEADYLRDEDLVFGVAINGDVRAYPLRIMGWHEMFNEVIGGVPVALAYCTLCGAGVLFETGRDGETPFVFGSSGFLYRSNKLMFDRQTHSLWNQFTGRPVVGPLAESGIALRRRPVVIDTWRNWRAANPGTKVLSLRTGYLRNYGPGVVYSDYFASPDLMFPAAVDETRQRQKDYVFGVQTLGAAKAWPLDAFAGGRVINDAVGATPLVLIGAAETRSVRAYAREAGETFETGADGLVTPDGTDWTVTEAALVAADGRRRDRVAGHVAYWFAWDGYLGEAAELYEG
ncbi:MAG: DUF3179 domain-containing protein [Rhodobacter sp.]|nr:DUF3179 domain-containing protein [Rhodobacter sp.]